MHWHDEVYVVSQNFRAMAKRKRLFYRPVSYVRSATTARSGQRRLAGSLLVSVSIARAFLMDIQFRLFNFKRLTRFLHCVTVPNGRHVTRPSFTAKREETR